LERPGLDKAAGEEFLREAVQILLDEAVRKGTDVTEKVCEWKEPEELRELLDLELPSRGEPPEKLLERCRAVIRYSVRTGQHPPTSPPPSLSHFSPTCVRFGPSWCWSGASWSQFCLSLSHLSPTWARFGPIWSWFGPGWSHFGLSWPQTGFGDRVLPSPSRSDPRLLPAQSHYSIQKGAAFLGIGTDNVHLVATDQRGKMVPEELEKEIRRAKAEGAEPFFVCATCGTTVLGAFDPLGSIADICQRHGLWLHVDAAWGGSALLSPKHRHLLAGIERRVTLPSTDPPLKTGSKLPVSGPSPHSRGHHRVCPPLSPRADSVAWNPHKMLAVGLQCSAFLLRDASGLLQRCHGAGATYLFQPDKFYDVAYDTGDKTPQCGRRVDCLKLWLLWKAAGTQGLARRVERAFAFTRWV
ncbi:CSAD decarboxylase, partial [Glareola pratincola]|nr:CSAD decarboxylase [Glareola pratincola]